VSVLMYKGVNGAFSQTCEMIKEDYGDMNSIQTAVYTSCGHLKKCLHWLKGAHKRPSLQQL